MTSVECKRNTLEILENIIVLVTHVARRKILIKTVQKENHSSQHMSKKICHVSFVKEHVAESDFVV